MNRSLVFFSLFLIVVGAFFGLYLVSFFGLLMLIPAFLAASKPLPRPRPSPPSQAPRRISPPPETKAETPAQAPSQPGDQSKMMPLSVPEYGGSTGLSYSPPLFPTPMLLTSMPSAVPSPPRPKEPGMKEGSRDELVEVVALLALLKLAFD